MPTCHMHTQHVDVYLQVYQHAYTTYQHAICNCNMLSCMHNIHAQHPCTTSMHNIHVQHPWSKFMGWPTRQFNSNQVALKKTFKLLRSSACLETIVMGVLVMECSRMKTTILFECGLLCYTMGLIILYLPSRVTWEWNSQQGLTCWEHTMEHTTLSQPGPWWMGLTC